jgi:hypothetical protein
VGVIDEDAFKISALFEVREGLIFTHEKGNGGEGIAVD